jgi:hypothetical protein
MKSLAMLVVAACTLTGCTGDSSSKADGSGVAGAGAFGRSDDQPTMAASPPVTTRDAGSSGGVSSLSSVNESAVDAKAENAALQPRSTPDVFQNANSGAALAPAMMIRIGQAFIEVDKVDPAILRIQQLSVQVGGYIANSSVSGGRDQIRQATLELKVPAAKYNEAVSALSAIGKVETVNSTAQDIGEEFVDVSARVSNARRLEERLITLLSTRTGKLDEVLRVERELARVREEIERYEGRLRYLSSRVATSTLTITVHEPAPILGSSPGENPIAAALRRAWKNFVAVIAGLISSLGVLIPLALLGLAAWMGYRRWKAR